MARSGAALDSAHAPLRAQGTGALRAGVLGDGHRRNRRPSRAHRSLARRPRDTECALHRNHLAAGGHRADAILQSTGRHRGDARHDLQHGRPRRSALHVRHVGRRFRSAHGSRRRRASSYGARTRTHRRRMLTITGCPRRPGRWSSSTPIRTPTAAQADIHLQPFPGSDAALAFAMLHVIHRDGLIDRGFIAAHVKGWEELEPRSRRCDPAKLSARHRSARRAHRGSRCAPVCAPAHRCCGWARACSARRPAATSCAPARCCPRSPAICASRAPGFLYLNGNLRQRGMDEDYLTGAHLRRGASAGGQPHGSRRRPGRPGAIAGAVRVEHESAGLLSAAGSPAPCARSAKTC